jgi:hypothetical protein
VRAVITTRAARMPKASAKVSSMKTPRISTHATITYVEAGLKTGGYVRPTAIAASRRSPTG